MYAEQITFFPTTRTNETSEARRLHERFIADGDLTHYTEREILIHLIGFIDRSDRAAEMAARLLDEFGSLKGVLEARAEQLVSVRGVSRRIASLISTAQEMVKVWERCAMQQPERIANSREAEAYCKSLLAGERIENFYVIALNAQCRILGARKIATGSLSEVSAYPRLVMETALNYNAHSVLLSHNHPGGTCAPSAEDIASTQQLQRLLAGVGIIVLDHMIIAGASAYSMIEHGDITYRNH